MTRTPLLSLALLFTVSLAACGDDGGTEVGDSGTGTETGDTGTSDEVGESSSSSSSTTSTDETTTTTTTDEGSCPVGSEGCPCTGGGGCDPGLVCEGDVCTMPAGTDTTSDTGTTDATTTDTTSDTGMDPMPYQACPNGDADCAPGETCVMGAAMMGAVPWTMCTSGTCMADDDCAVDDNDVCDDLPGDGAPIDYCVPFRCDMDNPCPDPMVCVTGFGGASSVCVWPL